MMTKPMTPQRKRLLLIAIFAVALVVTVIFGVRFVRRVLSPPDREPIRGWQNIPYIARAYRVNPNELHVALGLTPGQPDRRPIEEIAKSQNRPLDEVIQTLQKRIEEIAPGPPRRRPRLPTSTP
jgi:hypothetical protein